MPLLSFLGSSTPAVTCDLTREQIQAQSNKLRLSDSDLDTNLDLFCYNRCDNEEAQLVKNCRGVVFNGTHIVLRGFPYTEEYTTDSQTFNKLKDMMNDSWESYKFFEAREGALLRVFNWQSKWYISTHRKLDAFRSKWASKDSFGQIFKSALENLEEQGDEMFKKQLEKGGAGDDDETGDVLKRYLDTLDPKYQYMFLILNNYDNRIVCVAPDKPQVYHVGTIPLDNSSPPAPENKCLLDYDAGLPFPKEYKFSNFEELKQCVDGMNYEQLQGVIVFDTKNNRQYKVFNQEYFGLFKIRGNEPSVKYRYLQVRMDKEMVDKLYYLYPKYADAFDDYENTLYECAKKINKNYIDRFN